MKNFIGCLLVLIMLSSMSLAQSASNKGPVEGLPRVVARVKLTDQTADVNRTVFTPKSNGLFRASVVMFTVVPTGMTNRYWFPVLTWYDVTPESVQGPNVSVEFLGSQQPQMTYTFSAKRGKPIKLFTGSTGDVSGSAYDIFIVIERLTKIPSF